MLLLIRRLVIAIKVKPIISSSSCSNLLIHRQKQTRVFYFIFLLSEEAIYDWFIDFFKVQKMKLSESEREIHVKPLLENGWVLVTARDAIYK